jgi:MtfA peptidase
VLVGNPYLNVSFNAAILSTPALIVTLLLLLLLAVVGWYWFFPHRPAKIPRLAPDLRLLLAEQVHYYQQLPEPEKIRFEAAVADFWRRVTITGVETTVEDLDRVLVAASAVIPLFGFPGWHYVNLNEILLYGGTFDEDYDTRGGDRHILGMVGSGAMNRMMILSQPALRQGFAQTHSRSNVGIHEFVHLLDKGDGQTDGIPEMLLQQQFVIPWVKLMHHEIAAIQQDHSDINPYGATNEAEFLSVVSEYFFTQPHLLEAKHPKLYALLTKIFHQHPGGQKP